MLALTPAVDSVTLRTIDVAFIHKDATGNVNTFERSAGTCDSREPKGGVTSV